MKGDEEEVKEDRSGDRTDRREEKRREALGLGDIDPIGPSLATRPFRASTLGTEYRDPWLINASLSTGFKDLGSKPAKLS
jgi:hypothetical protein